MRLCAQTTLCLLTVLIAANAGVVDCHLLYYKGPSVIRETCSSVSPPTGEKLNKSN